MIVETKIIIKLIKIIAIQIIGIKMIINRPIKIKINLIEIIMIMKLIINIKIIKIVKTIEIIVTIITMIIM